MRRSILIVMLDVMVLSVLALTARQRAGGGAGNIPAPSGQTERLIEEGLRNEAGYQSEIARLEAQLKESAELSRHALEQVAEAEARAERQRAENLTALAKLHQAEMAAVQATSQAQVASREAELVNQQVVEAKAKTLALELREREAKARANAALTRVALAEQQAERAERRAAEAEQSAGSQESQVLAFKEEAAVARAERKVAEQRAQELSATLARREADFNAAKVAEIEAVVKATVAISEKERLEVKTEQVAVELVEARVSVATLEEREKSGDAKIAKLEADKKAAEVESNKSVWIRRDEAMRRLKISYTEENSSDGRLYRVDKELSMPLVQMGQFSLVPAEFKSLGLKKTFFGGGLSALVTEVRGFAAPMVGEAAPGSLRALIVPSVEPQVCLAHTSASVEGALMPITMAGIKTRRLRTAMLFSAKDVNAYGLVEIVPMIGTDYLTVRTLSGNRPKVGDYLLTDRGEFVGVLVKNDICYVLPKDFSQDTNPVIIPLQSRGKKENYLSDFVKQLNAARALEKKQSKRRGF